MAERKTLSALEDALIERGYLHKNNVFCHEPTYTPIKDSPYEFKIEIVKWNTRSSQLVVLAARWDTKKSKWILSTYKTGSVKRQAHGEKMR